MKKYLAVSTLALSILAGNAFAAESIMLQDPHPVFQSEEEYNAWKANDTLSNDGEARSLENILKQYDGDIVAACPALKAANPNFHC